MINTTTRCVAIALTSWALVGYSCSSGAENSVRAISSTETTTTQSKFCHTFGFRNWSLERDEQSVKVSAEARMPTPAWEVVLHHDENADSGTIRLIMETIEPTELSSSVISWIGFEKIVSTSASKEAELSVLCTDEVVWSSQEN